MGTCCVRTAVVAWGLCGTMAWAANINEFINFSLSDGSTTLLPGRLYVPPAAALAAPRPLMLFLHGSSVVGNDNVSHITYWVTDIALKDAKERGAYLYMPQTPSDWGDVAITNGTIAMLERALADHNVDVDRIYCSGISLGGSGVWNFLNRRPDYFAAGMPLASSAPAGDFAAARLIGEPIWAFHARDDAQVSVVVTRDLVSGILAAAGESLPIYPSLDDRVTYFEYHHDMLDLHYSESPTGGHTGAPRNPGDMLDWMFGHGILAGDYSRDGVVDGADLLVWQRGYGSRAGTLPNDADAGPIGPAHYNTWQTNFGTAGPTTSASIPEPSGWVLGIVAALQGVWRRRPVRLA